MLEWLVFGLVRKLRADVNQLQAEKFALLRSRNAELEKEVQARTAEIQEQLERDRLLAKIALRIHQSLNLNEIINAAVTEVQQFLKADRVVLFQVKFINLGEGYNKWKEVEKGSIGRRLRNKSRRRRGMEGGGERGIEASGAAQMEARPREGIREG